MIKDDGSVIHFNNPKVQASLNANTFAISGHAENKQIAEMLPGILNHLGSEGFNQLKRIASTVNAISSSANVTPGIDEEDDDVPELVEDFESASKNDTAAMKKDDKDDADADDEGEDEEENKKPKKEKKSKSSSEKSTSNKVKEDEWVLASHKNN